MVPPYNHEDVIAGQSTVAVEAVQQMASLDLSIDDYICPIGGGGLIAGVGSIIKQKFPNCRLIGVEPKGASSLTDSLEKGRPVDSFKINTIADSLSPPLHLPISFSVCQKVIDQMVLVTDLQMQQAMKFMSLHCKFILEPACVAGIAALQGPLKDKLKNQKTLVILCGANIDMQSWIDLTNLN